MPTTPIRSLRCVDAEAARKLADDLAAEHWDNVHVDGDIVEFPSNNPAGIIAVAEYALQSDYAHDTDCAALIASLG